MKTTYLVLLNFTDQGVRNIKESPHRATAWKQKAEASGVKVVAQLWTAGEYDGALVLEAPSEEKILWALAELSLQGNVRTQSLRAFDATEFAAALGK
jgi:uncharacterized protein with GYD domain